MTLRTDETLPHNFIRHCPHCGSHEFKAQSTKEFLCGACGFNFFTNSAAAAVALISDTEGRLLMCRRGRQPGLGMLDLPGGFAEPSEKIEDALQREIQEELQCEVYDVQYFASEGNHYIFSGYMVFTTDMAFTCRLKGKPEAADDVASLVWLRPEEINLDEIAFDSIRQLTAKYIEKHK